MLARSSDGSLQRGEMPSLHVLSATTGASAFTLPKDAPAKTEAIMCLRSTLIPAPDDFKVVLAGFPFFIGTLGEPAKRRMLALEISDGRLQGRMVQGQLTARESEQLQERLNQMQTTIQSTE